MAQQTGFKTEMIAFAVTQSEMEQLHDFFVIYCTREDDCSGFIDGTCFGEDDTNKLSDILGVDQEITKGKVVYVEVTE